MQAFLVTVMVVAGATMGVADYLVVRARRPDVTAREIGFVPARWFRPEQFEARARPLATIASSAATVVVVCFVLLALRGA